MFFAIFFISFTVISVGGIVFSIRTFRAAKVTSFLAHLATSTISVLAGMLSPLVLFGADNQGNALGIILMWFYSWPYALCVYLAGIIAWVAFIEPSEEQSEQVAEKDSAV